MNLPTANPLAGKAASAFPLGKSASGNSNSGNDGAGGDPAAAFGALLSEQSAADAGGPGGARSSFPDAKAPNVKAPDVKADGGSTSWSRQRSSFEARLGEAIASGDAGATPDKTASLAAALRKSAASSPPAGDILPAAGIAPPSLAGQAAQPGASASDVPILSKPRSKGDAQSSGAGDASMSPATPVSSLDPSPALNAGPIALLMPSLAAAPTDAPSAGTATPRDNAASSASGPAVDKAPISPGAASSSPSFALSAFTAAAVSDAQGSSPAAAALTTPAMSAPVISAAIGASFPPGAGIGGRAGAAMPPVASARGSEKAPLPAPSAGSPQSASSGPSSPSDLLAGQSRGSDAVQPVAARLPDGQGAGSSLSGKASDTRQLAPTPLATVSVVGQETHAAPVMSLTPVQQLAGSIVDAAGGPQSTLPQEAAGVPTATTRIRPLQVLNIRLDPPDLGAVSVKMRLTGSRLDLNIEVGQKDTVPLLGKDGDALSKALQSTGYTVDNLTIKAAANSGLGAQHQHDSSQGQQSASHSSAQSGQSGSAQGGDGRSNQRTASQGSFAQGSSGQGSSGQGHDGAPDNGRSKIGEDVVHQNSPSGDLYV
ncbi:hook-length control protein FliK [Rhizobiales bacterium GAS191]|nr:hook-length control protein FliK [Rhizobiales bacterium GAS191]